jgi:hypothetical protein
MLPMCQTIFFSAILLILGAVLELVILSAENRMIVSIGKICDSFRSREAQSPENYTIQEG